MLIVISMYILLKFLRYVFSLFISLVIFIFANNFNNSFIEDHHDIEPSQAVLSTDHINDFSVKGNVVDNSFLLNVELSEDFSMGNKNICSCKYKRGENFAIRLYSLIIDIFKRVLVNDFRFFQRNSRF
jgi:hypothetical protein